MAFRAAALLLLVVNVAAQPPTKGVTPAAGCTGDTPVTKVICLLKGMRDKLKEEASAESETYNKFACFCKDNTVKKSKKIRKNRDNIDTLSADIADKTATREEKQADTKKRLGKVADLTTELAAEKARCKKGKEEFEAKLADLSLAIERIKKALKALDTSKNVKVQMPPPSKFIQETVALADAMGIITQAEKRVVASFLQADPDRYEYHGNPVIAVLKKMQDEFTSEHSEVAAEFDKFKKACAAKQKALQDEIDSNNKAIAANKKDILRLGKEIAQHRKDLIEEKSDLEDNEAFLKDLTAECEAKANDFDQRRQMRADELKAVVKALQILQKKVKASDELVNARTKFGDDDAESCRKKNGALLMQEMATPMSFVQTEQAIRRSLLSNNAASQEMRTQDVISLLESEGKRLDSSALLTLAMRVAKDPFKKIKGIIQKLIERLLAEAAEEATKKGFCDEQLGKARKDQEFRTQEVKDLLLQSAKLTIQIEELEDKIKLETDEKKDVDAALLKASKIRIEDKANNICVLADARAGLAAVKEALHILKAFYKDASNGKLIIDPETGDRIDADAPSLIQESPIVQAMDEDLKAKGAGFEGDYTGNTEGSHAIIGLLEVIVSDYQRTLGLTDTNERKSAADFVEFDRSSKVRSKTLETSLENAVADLKGANTALKKCYEDLDDNMGLLDKAFQTIEDLKPGCIDTGMSYAERVQKREDEIKALCKAFDILARGVDGAKGPDGCSSGASPPPMKR